MSELAIEEPVPIAIQPALDMLVSVMLRAMTACVSFVRTVMVYKQSGVSAVSGSEPLEGAHEGRESLLFSLQSLRVAKMGAKYYRSIRSEREGRER